MGEALDEFRIEGINHNIDFLNAIMHSARFREGRLSTAFIAEEYPEGFRGRPLDDDLARRFVAAALVMKLARTRRASEISGTLNGPHFPAAELEATVGDRTLSVTDTVFASGHLSAMIEGQTYACECDWQPGEPTIRLAEGGRTYVLHVARLAGSYRFSHGGTRLIVSVRRPEAARLAELMQHKAVKDTSNALRCPMPGLVVSVIVKEGQDVKSGDPLAVVEAMKMENVLTAERDAVVKKINAKKGDSVALDQVIIEFA
jgi:propionyl-CoA carboxylase alpha chain